MQMFESIPHAEVEKIKETVLRPRVEKGIAYMDEYHPGWAEKIRLDQLCMESCYNCIGGQVLGDYLNLTNEINRNTNCSVNGADMGFDFLTKEIITESGRAMTVVESGLGAFTEYEALESLWTEEIQRRIENND